MPKDSMANFQLFQPTDIGNALEVIDRYGEDSWIMAGGQDSLDWFKDRAKQPGAVVDINGIDELKGIKETADGIEIGALTTLTEVIENSVIKEKYGVLAEAASNVASPQIRNVGTIGGNISQDARCWYYRYGLDCYRAGGNTCYADTPEGIDREHCLFGADRCVAVSPSDTAPALVVLDAQVVIVNADGEKTVPIEEFFLGPDIDITRMTILQPGDILKAVKIPATWAGARFYFEKVADRGTWDFALVNVALAMFTSGGRVNRVRASCGGVQCVPRRLTGVEDLLVGEVANDETAEMAGSVASRGAKTLNFNHFKVPLMQNLVKRAIRNA